MGDNRTSDDPPNSETDGIKKATGDSINLNVPFRVTSVNFEGAKRTRPALVAKIVSDIYKAKTVLEFVERCGKINENLMSLNAFNDVEVQVKPNNNDYEVTFVLHERRWISASIQTAVDDISTHLGTSLNLPNLNGIGDFLQLNAKLNKRLYSGEFRYSVPLSPWKQLWSPVYTMSYCQYLLDTQPSGFDQEDKSIINQVEFFSLNNLKHTIGFENIWRYVKSSGLRTPIEIREQCGHSVKSSLKHILTWDNRVGGNYPYEGILAKLTNEITTNLVSGCARFTRHEVNLQMNQLLLPRYDLLCQFNVLAGTLTSRDKGQQKINICDKFFSGGPMTLRGFKYQGLGANVREHPLGDYSFISAGLHLYSILPYTSPLSPINQYIRPHIFFNAGTIGNINDVPSRVYNREDMKRELDRFKHSLRYSCGLGLVFYFMKMRFELNYNIPLVTKNSDLSVRGLQWGFGLHYT